VSVTIYNERSRIAIPVQSTAKTVRSQRIEIQLVSETLFENKKLVFVFCLVEDDNGFENVIKRSLSLTIFDKPDKPARDDF